MDPLKALEAKVDALETKLERRVTATSARKLARVHLLIAADNEDNPDTQMKITAALAALGE
jgi:hypothetical protein